MVAQRGMFPSAQFRQWTSDLNRALIKKFSRQLPHKVIVNCIDIQVEESIPRSLLSPLALNRSNNEPHITDFQSSTERFPMCLSGTDERCSASSGVRAGISQEWKRRRVISANSPAECASLRRVLIWQLSS
jgi:hypothetical protein